jgi:hypothetical protein
MAASSFKPAADRSIASPGGLLYRVSNGRTRLIKKRQRMKTIILAVGIAISAAPSFAEGLLTSEVPKREGLGVE